MQERRRRRSSAEVQARIIEASRTVFSARGYESATTRDIAQQADVSETLLFRYFSSKAALFEKVVVTPFDQLMGRFLLSRPEQATYAQRVQNSEVFIAELLTYLNENRAIVSALTTTQAANGSAEKFDGLRSYFAAAAAQVRVQQDATGGAVDVPPDLSVRLGFGMVVASVLMRDWLFPDGAPDGGVVAASLARMLTRALGTNREMA
jgi:AcrR family transcriptional regulator